MKKKTVDISGMGGGYEHECQRMLWNGIRYLEKNNLLNTNSSGIVYKGFENVYGVCFAESEEAKALDAAIMDGIDDATGAMHQAVVGHLRFISQNNVEKWLAQFTNTPAQRARIFEWDETVNSCPKTDLSEEMEKKQGDA